MEGIPGRLLGRSFTRAVLKTILAVLTSHITREREVPLGEATGVSEARRVGIATGRIRPPR
jgi:hypothetical protein